MTIFNPPVTMRSIKTGNVGALCVKDDKLAIWNKSNGARVIAPDYVVIERTPVTGWLTGILLDAWLQFAHCEPGGCLNSGGLDVLEDIHDVLVSASLIDADGQPRKEMAPPAGAGGMIEKERE